MQTHAQHVTQVTKGPVTVSTVTQCRTETSPAEPPLTRIPWGSLWPVTQQPGNGTVKGAMDKNKPNSSIWNCGLRLTALGGAQLWLSFHWCLNL
jgi:hypothetical protein